MVIYLHCEGNTDYTVIPCFIRKAINNFDLDIQWIKRDVLKKIKIHRKSNITISGSFKLLKALATYSYLNNCKHIVYHQDGDGKYSENYNKIINEFIHLKQINFHCLAVVPKETIESWLLADENAYPSIPKNPSLPEKPEKLWGNKKEENSNHPKRIFNKILNQFNLENTGDTYANIAENIDINVLKEKCDISFGQFVNDAQEFLLRYGE